ncbi:MAG: hypothetical protein KDD48_00370 [Bdellovibrionales bacterium]|nr:hypothetical protein [Bdellovibrionales bacterium]
MSKEGRILIVLVLSVAFLYFLQYLGSQRQLNAVRSVTGHTGSGLALSLEFLGEKASVFKQPFLFPKHLDSVDALIIDSPNFSISHKETSQLVHFVARGGHLYLSFLKENHFNHLQNILRAFKIDTQIKKDPNFRNDYPKKVLYAPFGRISMYSQLFLDHEGCENSATLACYIIDKTYGKGKVVLQAGLPIFSNGLLRFPENQQMLLALEQRNNRILFDGYHQFMAEKSWGDFLSDYRLSLPLISLVIFLFIYMAFSKPRTPVVLSQLNQTPSYLSFYEEVFTSSLFKRKANWPNIISLVSKALNQNVGHAPNKLSKKTFLLKMQELISSYRQTVKSRKDAPNGPST